MSDRVRATWVESPFLQPAFVEMDDRAYLRTWTRGPDRSSTRRRWSWCSVSAQNFLR